MRRYRVTYSEYYNGEMVVAADAGTARRAQLQPRPRPDSQARGDALQLRREGDEAVVDELGFGRHRYSLLDWAGLRLVPLDTLEHQRGRVVRQRRASVDATIAGDEQHAGHALIAAR